jgi:hypothetical protein
MVGSSSRSTKLTFPLRRPGLVGPLSPGIHAYCKKSRRECQAISGISCYRAAPIGTPWPWRTWHPQISLLKGGSDRNALARDPRRACLPETLISTTAMGLLRPGTPHRPQLIQLLRNMLQVNHLSSQERPCIDLPYHLQSPSKPKSSLSGFPHLMPRGGSDPRTVTLTVLTGRPASSTSLCVKPHFWA